MPSLSAALEEAVKALTGESLLERKLYYQYNDKWKNVWYNVLAI